MSILQKNNQTIKWKDILIHTKMNLKNILSERRQT
jgi:hypothetical protein